MDFIAKNLLRGAGFLVAVQIFMTLALTGDDLGDKFMQAAKLALLPIPLLGLGAFLSTDNGLRTIGYTVLLWAGAGAAVFFGSVYGSHGNELPYVQVPDPSQVSLPFGLANFAVVLVAGGLLWLSGLKLEPTVGHYHDIGRR
jgi:hypothetical protein